MKRLLAVVVLISGLAYAAQPKIVWSAPDWQATTAYTPGTFIKPSGSPFFQIAMDGGGTSLGAPPTWCTLQNCKTADGTKLAWIALPIEQRVYCPNGATVPLGCTPSGAAGASSLTFDAKLFVTSANGSTINLYGDGATSPFATFTQNCGTSCLQTIPAVVLPVTASSHARHTVRAQVVETGVITGTADTSFDVDYTPSNTGCTVSLTFDDSIVTQWGYQPTDGSAYISTVNLLEKYGMKGSFFVNWPRIMGQLRGDSSHNPGVGFLTVPMVLDLQRRGHEVGSHTINHLHVPCLTTAFQHDEIGNDANLLLDLGLFISTVAYPFGAENPTTWQVDIDNRLMGGRAIKGGFGNTAPPDNNNAFVGETSLTTESLATLQGYVTACETPGNAKPWLIINAHAVTPGRVSPAGMYVVSNTLLADSVIYEQFLAWLQPRAANGTVVKTVRQVMGGTQPDQNTWPHDTNPANKDMENWSNPAVDCTVIPTLETVPDCFQAKISGASDGVLTMSQLDGGAHTGQFAWKIVDTGQTVGSYDIQNDGNGWPLFYQPDPQCPASVVTPGTAYTIGFWYQSDQAQQFHIWVFRKNTGTTNGTCFGQTPCPGSWASLTMTVSNVLAASPGVWAHAQYTIPASGSHSLAVDVPDALYIGWGIRTNFVGTSTTFVDGWEKAP